MTDMIDVNNKEEAYLAQELACLFGQLTRSGNRSRSFQGLRQSEFTLLTTVSYYAGPDSKGIKISEISKALQMTPAGATHLADALEAEGMLERLPDPGDRRIVLVRVTAKGEAQIRATETHFLQVFKGLAAHLGEQDSTELIRLLQTSMLYLKNAK